MPPTDRPITENLPLAPTEGPGPCAPVQPGVNGAAPELMSEEEFRQKNQRRIELIHKDLNGHLTLEEAAELQRLRREIRAYVNDHFPLPPVNMELLEQIARRLGANLDCLEDS